MITTKRILSLTLLLSLLAVVLLSASLATGSIAQAAPRTQPLLLTLAAQQPEATISVIVQKTVKDTSVEALVAQLGGTVTKDLHIINAFAAEVKAKDALQLAHAAGVRWVSLDAPITTSDATQVVSVAWATNMGTAVANQFDSAGIVDSALGPNGVYGSGGIAKASFANIGVEDVPGNAVQKVEVVFYVYSAAKLQHDFNLNVYLAGKQTKSFNMNHSAFDNRIGPANVTPLYLDITSTRNWQWADFKNKLELVLDQTRFQGAERLYYDAIGLRVTSAPGVDSSQGAVTLGTPGSKLDGSKQINVYNTTIGATAVWNTSPYLQGNGVTVAVVDSGILGIPDLGGRLKERANFNLEYHDSSDRFGHGTFVAGIIAGDGTKSQGAYIGVAPKTNIVNVRVSNDVGGASESSVVNGLQWILQNKQKYNIRVVNLSLNSSVAQSYHTSPMDAAAEILWFNGIVVVVSAGNNETLDSGIVYPPANDPFVITVGALDDRGTSSRADDLLATFSAYGVTTDGFAKPELVAPGVNIISTLPDNDKLNLTKQHAANRIDNTYFRMSGTSMAAPMVSGAVALLLQSQPNLTPDQVKYRLMATAKTDFKGYDPAATGAGLLKIDDAIKGNTTGSANTGIAASQLLWTGGQPITWGSVTWNSVNWNSVTWNSVNWNSVTWNSVTWNSDYWGQ